MSTLSVYSYTGWHTAATAKTEGGVGNGTFHNIWKVVGYIPIIGAITGVIDISVYTKDENQSCATRIYAFIRGIFQIVGLGGVFIIPDIAVSIHRHFCPKTLDIVDSVQNFTFLPESTIKV